MPSRHADLLSDACLNVKYRLVPLRKCVDNWHLSMYPRSFQGKIGVSEMRYLI